MEARGPTMSCLSAVDPGSQRCNSAPVRRPESQGGRSPSEADPRPSSSGEPTCPSSAREGVPWAHLDQSVNGLLVGGGGGGGLERSLSGLLSSLPSPECCQAKQEETPGVIFLALSLRLRSVSLRAAGSGGLLPAQAASAGAWVDGGVRGAVDARVPARCSAHMLVMGTGWAPASTPQARGGVCCLTLVPPSRPLPVS